MDKELEKLPDQQFYKIYETCRSAIAPVITREDFFNTKNPLAELSKAAGEHLPGNNLSTLIFEYLKRELRKLSAFIYLYMEKADDWGVMGEQRIAISLCRNFLDIDNDREVTQFDADRFRRIIDQIDDQQENKPADYYLHHLRNGSFDFFGLAIPLHSLSRLTTYLEKLGLDFSLTVTNKKFPQFILAKKKTLEIGKDLQVEVIGKEYVRSPYYVLSVAAESQKVPFIRKEACEVIFFNKWQKFFQKTKLEQKKALNHPNSAISEGIKKKTLQLYNIQNVDLAKQKKPEFINDMIDGIIWHELGHKVANSFLDPMYKSMGNHFVGTEYFPTVLNEALADWAPAGQNMKGSFSRFLEIAKKDPAKANRVIYAYLSDNWFIDENEEFLALHTDVLTALALHFANSDGTFDFERMENELEAIFNFLVKVFETMMEKIHNIFEQAKFTVGNFIYTYETMEKEVEKIYKGTVNEKPLAELKKFNSYWVNMFGFLKKFAPQDHQKLKDYLEQSSQQLSLTILKNISKGSPEKYNNSLRKYILDKYQEIGILTQPAKIDWQKAIEQSMQEIKLPPEIADKVCKKFEKIMRGEEYDISINYDGKKDPFIATLQNMMVKSNYGSINAPIVLAQDLHKSTDIKEKIKDELDTIRDQLDSEMYLEIKELKVSSDNKDTVKEVLPEIKLYDGTALKDKIETLKVGTTTSGAPIEVYIPLKIGYMDWNTSQAVWRINQDLRPEEFIMQWTIDHHFLEELVKAYS